MAVPAAAYLKLYADQKVNQGKYAVYNNKGQKWLEGVTLNCKTNMYLLAAGIYTIQITQRGTPDYKRFAIAG